MVLDLTLLGMDPNISDSEMDPHAMQSGTGPSFLDEDFDSEEDASEVHPIVEPLSMGHPGIYSQGSLPDRDSDTSVNLDEDEPEAVTADAEDLPEVVERLRKELLSGYTSPNHPPLADPRGRSLTPAEKLSLRHYIAWVDSRGTVKAYKLHAEVLQNAAHHDILSLYLVRKLATELTGLSSQLVDMCPKSCMAYTGEFKTLKSCIYVRDKRLGPCGQPRYDKNLCPRAQMLYTPIAPVIQSLYKNREMAEAMRYRHEHLQEALTKLPPGSHPHEYSDFAGSVSHINHSHLFQEETDTAITISGDGAQLTMKKQSDVWVLIVTILNLPPNMRSRAANIIIPLVIPGPSSPGNVESFVYVLYEELAKLSLGVWAFDALTQKYFILRVFLCGVLGDMLGSAKLSRMAGHMALYGCRFSMVRGARPSNDKGAKAQYYPLSTPQKEIKDDCPPFEVSNLKIRDLEEYWKTIERLENVKNNKAKTIEIVQETGVSGLPICAASPAFSHPFFFPLDPFHLFYENCMPHFWDIWVTSSDSSEIVYMSQDVASRLGALAESAMETLSSSFCGPIRDPYKKRQSQYKIYEWMALLHWYIVPILWELGFNSEVVKNFAMFSNIVEYAMTAVTRTDKDLVMLQSKIIHFLRDFERLYVGDIRSKITRCRLCVFQLIHIPIHIVYNGSIRFGSQATCEWAIGDIGHGIGSKKSHFKNILTYKADKQSARMLHLYYPTLFSVPEARPQRTCLFKEVPITREQRKGDDDFKVHLQAIKSYLGVESDPTLQRWGKCPLPDNVTLTSQLFELSKKATSRSSRYFEAHLLRKVLQSRDQSLDQSIDETELEVETTIPVFGEALAFYTVAETKNSLVAYHPLIKHQRLFGRWYGEWSPMVDVLETSAIVSLIGIWTLNDHVHILRRHPGLTILTPDECGIDSGDPLVYVE